MYFERYFGARPKEPNSEEECWNLHRYFIINMTPNIRRDVWLK